MSGLTPLSGRYIGAAVLGGIIIAGMLFEGSEPEVAIAPSAPVKQHAENPVQPVMPQGYAPEVVIRNPFAIPQEFASSHSTTSPPATPPTVTLGVPSNSIISDRDRPILTGIMGTQDRWAVIIKYRGTSRSYQVGDAIGPYELVGVTAEGATITGPGGSYLLKVSAKREGEKK